MPNTANIFEVRVMEDSGASIMARVRNPSGLLIQQNTITSISLKYRRKRGTGAITSSNLTVADVVFDTLQTDSRWSKDSTGYNFRWDAPASVFAEGDGQYGIDFLFTPTSGAAYYVSVLANVQKRLTS